MKKTKLLYLILPFFLFSCEKYLDVNPDMGLDPDDIYAEYYAYRGVLDRAHWYVKDYMPSPDFKKRDYVPGMMSDEMHTLSFNRDAPVNAINNGDWLNFQTSVWEISCGDFGFTPSYEGGSMSHRETSALALAKYGLRAANQVVANIDKLKEFPDQSSYTPKQLRDQILGQGYFLRAWFYFEYIRRLGGMPEMREVFEPDTYFDKKRPSYQESTRWLVEDLDSAIALLPEKWDDANGGRPTAVAAKALKAMALLYSASPNMNLAYGEQSDITADDCGYNQEILDTAIMAAVEAVKVVYDNNNDGLINGMYPWGTEGAAYMNNFYSKTEKYSREALYFRMPKESPIIQNSNTGKGAWRLAYDGGYAPYSYAPTQNIVEMFETASGYDVNDPFLDNTVNASTADYDKNKPYEKRDPRLRANIFVNGDVLYQKPANNSTFEPFIGANASVAPGFHHKYLRTTNSLDWTGYEVKGKLRWPGQNNIDFQAGYYTTYPFIRGVQVYLDLAEVANEKYGPQGIIPGADEAWNTAEKCINIVRARVGMPGVIASYVADKAKFRERIRNERAVELFLEFHRWHDIRRWKTAEDELKLIEGVRITKQTDGSFTYENVEMKNARTFEEKHYWYPMSLSVEDMMTNFEQNPGW